MTAAEDTEVMRLKRKDLVEVARRSHDLQTVLAEIKAKYGFKGVKYDYYLFWDSHNGDRTDSENQYIESNISPIFEADNKKEEIKLPDL